jgi:hypothetical protein
MELLGYLIKEASHNTESKEKLAKNLELITNVVIKVVETSESWKNKKVKKTV